MPIAGKSRSLAIALISLPGFRYYWIILDLALRYRPLLRKTAAIVPGRVLVRAAAMHHCLKGRPTASWTGTAGCGLAWLYCLAQLFMLAQYLRLPGIGTHGAASSSSLIDAGAGQSALLCAVPDTSRVGKNDTGPAPCHDGNCPACHCHSCWLSDSQRDLRQRDHRVSPYRRHDPLAPFLSRIPAPAPGSNRFGSDTARLPQGRLWPMHHSDKKSGRPARSAVAANVNLPVSVRLQ